MVSFGAAGRTDRRGGLTALLLFHAKRWSLPLMIGGLTVIVGLMLYTYGEMKAGKR